MLPSLKEIKQAADVVYRHMPPTPQFKWQQLNQRLGVDLLLKHENHTSLGAFKVRGGLAYFAALEEQLKQFNGVVCATRGNHGQSIANAAGFYGMPTTIVVPRGNSREKNAAMKSLGAKLFEHGDEFQESLEHAELLADRDSLHLVPSYHYWLVAGIATYSMELLSAAKSLDALYVPIGQGSGICGALAAKQALGVKTEIVGVVSSSALAYSKSFNEKCAIESPVTTRIADGVACRKTHSESLAHIIEGVDRITEVSDQEVEQAMRDIFETTHNVAEGAGAAAVAAIAKDVSENKAIFEGKQVAAVLTGGNVDRDVFARVLSE